MNQFPISREFALKSIIPTLFYSLKDFVAPKHCLVCKEYIGISSTSNNFLCNKCYDNLPFAGNKESILNRFKSNFGSNCFINSAVSLINLHSNQNYLEIIHAIKYSKFKSVATDFSNLLANRILIENMDNFDYVLPIPIHTAKKRERGFNQSDLIARIIANKLSKEFRTDIIYRSKYTITQTLLDKSGRMKNMENVFAVRLDDLVKNKSFLFVDDVLTTGSTINSAAKTLINAGAARVYSATLAIAN